MASLRLVPFLLLATLGSATLAGCIGDSDPGPPGLAAPESPWLEDVDAAIAAGNLSANIETVGRWDDGGNQEIDAWGDYLFIMKNPRLIIVDVSDPANITQVSELTLPCAKDVKVSDDGLWAFVGCDNQGTIDGVNAGLRTDAVSFIGGFYVVDVSDKSNPSLASYLPVGPRRGPHMVYYHQTAEGDELVFGANADISINRFDRATGMLTELARYSPDIVTDWNRDVEVFDVYYQGFAHDMFVMDDPVENKTLLYVANWDAGLRIVDVSDPARPTEIGKWMDYPSGHAGNLHTVATAWIGDRRITVGAPEVGFAVVGGYHYAMGSEWTGLYVWDTTDASNIQLLGLWSNPIKPVAERGADAPFAALGEGVTSSHNLQLEDGRVYMAHYDYGLYVIDVSTAGLQETPATLAYFREDGMTTWDAIVHRGTVFLGDAKALYALHYLPDVLGETGISSRA